MKSWQYELGDVLRIHYKGQKVLARVAGHVDQLDDTKPLLANLRVAGGLRWGERQIKIQPEHVIEHLPNWYQEQHAQWEASIKAAADAIYAKMTPEQKRQLQQGMERRSPLDILIDRATGRE